MSNKYDLRQDQDLRDKMIKVIDEEFLPTMYPLYGRVKMLEKKLEAIADWWYGEAQRFPAPLTTSKIEFSYKRFRELLDLSEFTTKDDNDG